MVSDDGIRDARSRIADVMYRSCTAGQQSEVLPDGQMACGQFIGEGTGDRTQRGLHGTAAAIYVLAASSKDSSQTVVRQLINWVKAYRENGATGVSEAKLNQDRDNIIKTSELLYALSAVGGRIEVERYRNKVAEELIGARINDGWGYFRGQDESDRIIPTCYAVRALSSFGAHDELTGSVNWLANKMMSDVRSEGIGSPSDYSAYILILYTISHLKHDIIKEYQPNCKEATYHYWEQLSDLLRSDLEQNIEYWHEETSENKYVRVPWQLYFLCASVRFRPIYVFSRFTIQNRISTAVNKVLGGGFVYPHSGSEMSSRTYSILYETLERIKDKPNRSLLSRTSYYADSFYTGKFKRLINHPITRTVLIILVILFIIYTSFASSQSDGLPYTIAGAVISSIIVTIIGIE